MFDPLDMSAKRRVPNQTDDFDETDGPTTTVASNLMLSLSLSDPVAASPPPSLVLLDHGEPSPRDEVQNRKRPQFSRICEEQDCIMFSLGMLCFFILCCFSSLPLREDLASRPIPPDRFITNRRAQPSATGPSFFQDASHINANNGFFNAASGDQHINIITKTDLGTDQLTTFTRLFISLTPYQIRDVKLLLRGCLLSISN